MTGHEFVRALEQEGFEVRRRCRTFVWLARGDQTLLVDEDAVMPEHFLDRLLGRRSSPPSSRRAGARDVLPKGP